MFFDSNCALGRPSVPLPRRFDSDAPDFDPAPTTMAVRYAEVSEEEKAMIAGGNLARLLESAFNRGA